MTMTDLQKIQENATIAHFEWVDSNLGIARAILDIPEDKVAEVYATFNAKDRVVTSLKGLITFLAIVKINVQNSIKEGMTLREVGHVMD